MLPPPRRQGIIPSAQTIHRPAPVGGLNALSALSAMPDTDAVLLWNMLAAEYGLRARFGYREWATGLTGATDDLVRSVLPFAASTPGNSKLFATTSSGIWDVTSTGAVTAAYAAATAYVIDDFVTSGGLTFACNQAGTSHTSAGLPSLWAGTTAYSQDDRVINGSNVYICTTGGTSAGSGGPTGTGTGIADGTVVWDYQSASTAISDDTVTWYYKSSNTEPTLVKAFASTAGDAGYGSSTVFVSNASGGHTLIYCDEVNGLYYYREGGSWEKVIQDISGEAIRNVDPATLVYPIVFKGRVWYVEKDSGSAWYLPADSIFASGAGADGGTEFKFGNHFRAGGHLVGLYPWSYDGGAGVDDYLVAISSEGDILVYQVTDPADPTGIAQKGLWYAGGLPEGRNIATKHGGDLLILTKDGLLPLSRLVTGQSTDEGHQFTSYKIASLFNQLMYTTADIRGWSVHMHPEENALVVTYPTQTNQATEQLTMAVTGKAWSRTDLPIYSAAPYGGKFYFGTIDGRICINDGYLDNVRLADSNLYTDVAFSVITSFAHFGSPQKKKVSMVRAHWLSDGGDVQYRLEARYDFDLTQPSLPVASSSGGSLWDTGIWDTALWAGDYGPSSELRGVVGIGTHMAVAIRGKARARTVLTGLDILFTQGGFI